MPEAADLVLNPRRPSPIGSVRASGRASAKIFFHPEVTGAENIPFTGPVIIAPIHRSNVDFAFSLFISPRKVFFMAKEGVFHPAIFGALLTRLGAFPVNRKSADRESMRLSEEVLKRGQALVLFPEGTRKVGHGVEPLHDGAVFIAARTGAKIVPVGIAGSERADARWGEVSALRRRSRSWWEHPSTHPLAKVASRGLRSPRRPRSFARA